MHDFLYRVTAQTQQKVQILKGADGKLTVKGLMPGKLRLYRVPASMNCDWSMCTRSLPLQVHFTCVEQIHS